MRPAVHALACALACVLVLTSGCASPPVRRYTLLAPSDRGAVSTADGTTGEEAPGRPALRVRLDAVVLPEAVARSQIVQRLGEHRVAVLDYDRWAEPLDDAAARVLGQQLGARLGGVTVRLPGDPLPEDRPAAGRPAGDPVPTPEVRVAVDVTRFEQVPGREAHVSARWTVKSADGAVHQGASDVREPADATLEALVAAQARALQRVADDIAQAVAMRDRGLAGNGLVVPR